MRPIATLALLGCLLASQACGVTEGDFIAGAEGDPCMSNIPVCQTTAGCSINESIYLEGVFPGSRNFVVNTPADTEIEVKIFFKTRVHPGEDTEIRWYEPGCADYYAYESMGIDIFSKAGTDRVFSQSQKVRRRGDHLIEIHSDATTHYFVRVELSHPG